MSCARWPELLPSRIVEAMMYRQREPRVLASSAPTTANGNTTASSAASSRGSLVGPSTVSRPMSSSWSISSGSLTGATFSHSV